MFDARLDSGGGVLKKVMGCVGALVDSASFLCTPSAITLQAMDPSHVALVDLGFLAEAFTYRCDRSLCISASLKELSKILQGAANSDTVTLKSKHESSVLTLIFESATQGKYSSYDLKLMDIESEQLGIPNTEYQAQVRLPSAEFQKICTDAARQGDSLIISLTNKAVKWKWNGENSTGSIVLPASDEVKIKVKQEITSSFSIKFLVNFAKATPLSKFVTLKLTEGMPMVVEYKLFLDQEEKGGKGKGKRKASSDDEGASEGEQIGHLRFYLAPKIEDENNKDGQEDEEEKEAETDKEKEKEKDREKDQDKDKDAEKEQEKDKEEAEESASKTKEEKEGKPKAKKAKRKAKEVEEE